MLAAAVAAAVAAHVTEHAQTCRVLLEARRWPPASPLSPAAVKAAHSRTHEQLEGLVAAGVAAGMPPVTDPAQAARLFTTHLHGLMAQWHLAPGSFLLGRRCGGPGRWPATWCWRRRVRLRASMSGRQGSSHHDRAHKPLTGRTRRPGPAWRWRRRIRRRPVQRPVLAVRPSARRHCWPTDRTRQRLRA
jgi:hypothetical protein